MLPARVAAMANKLRQQENAPNPGGCLPEHFWTAFEVAEYLSKSVPSVYRLIHSKRLQAVKVGGEWRISEQALRQLLEDGIYV